MFVVEPRSLLVGDEELRPVGVLTRVGHGEETFLGVREPSILVVEFRAID